MKEIKETIKEYSLSILGSILAAFGTSTFLLPNQLSSGGFAGIATVIYYLFHVPMGTTIIILNIPVFILAYVREGKNFFVKTLISTFVFSQAINYFETIEPFTNDKILASVYGGMIIGLGLALVFKGKSSTGGTDLIANIIKSYHNEVSVGHVLQILDIVVVALNIVFLREIEIGLYSAIAIFIIDKMLDIIFEGINFSKMIYIISDQYQEISEVINQDIKRRSHWNLWKRLIFQQRKNNYFVCFQKKARFKNTRSSQKN